MAIEGRPFQSSCTDAERENANTMVISGAPPTIPPDLDKLSQRGVHFCWQERYSNDDSAYFLARVGSIRQRSPTGLKEQGVQVRPYLP